MDRFTDDLDQLTLPQRPRRPGPRVELRPDTHPSQRATDSEDFAQDEPGRSARHEDREFTLSTGTVLALFFGLALVCAIFFGFGYSMGRKSSAQTVDTAAATDVAAGTTSSPESAVSKPAAGSPAIQAIPGYLSQSEADSSNRQAAVQPYKPSATASHTESVTVPLAGPAPKKPVDTDVARDVTAPPPVRTPATTAVAPPVITPVSTASAASAGTAPVYVQIAAVSHKEDADVLLSALKRRGYSAFTRTADGDRFIHVQVGPFATKKDAEAMRQKLLGDGYNAMVK